MKTSSSIRVWAFAAAAMAAAACGSVSNTKADAGGAADSAPAGDFTLAVNPTTLSIGITGSDTAAVDISRGTGFTGAVALSVTGLPTGVTAGFDATSLPDGTNTTNLTLTVDNTASAGTTDITITGTAGTLSHDATLSLTLTTITVTGKVRFDRPNLTVRIVGKDSVLSDGTGNFTFTDVKVPYDIYVVGQEGLSTSPEPAVFYYKGLTRPDPVISAPSTTGIIVFPLVSSGTITGSRSGTGNNTNPTVIILGKSGKDSDGLSNTGGYSFTGSWVGFNSDCSNCTLYGLQWTTGARGEPTAYTGYGTNTPATISRGVSNTINLTFAAPATADLTGTITPPTGFPNPTLKLTQQFGNNVHELWSATTTNATSKIAVIAAGKSALYASSETGGRKVELVFPALVANTDVSYTLPAPPVQMGPAANATGITTATPFQFSTVPTTVYEVRMDNASGHFVVYTASNTVTIPSVTEVPVPTGASYTWKVNGWGPYADINSAADITPLEFVSTADFDGPTHYMLQAPSRNFTTQ